MNTKLASWFLAFATIPFCIATAQVSARVPPTKGQPTITVPFFATDSHGYPVAITTNDLSVLDNKKPPQSVVAIRTAKELPLRLGILIDTSKSEEKSRLHQLAVQEVSAFLNQVLSSPEDRAFIEGFSSVPQVADFMNRDELLKFKIDLRPGGGTALFDAVYVACSKQMQGDATQLYRRVLVILSDGGDNMSHVSHDKAIAAAQKAGTVIFAISTSEEPNGNIDTARLDQFADQTGGLAFVHLNQKGIPAAFSSIAEVIENMYAVTFVPADPGKPGQHRSIELRTTADKKVKLRGPKSYYVATEIP